MIWIASGIMIFASIFGIMLVAYIQHLPYDAAVVERARPKSYDDFVSKQF